MSNRSSNRSSNSNSRQEQRRHHHHQQQAEALRELRALHDIHGGGQQSLIRHSLDDPVSANNILSASGNDDDDGIRYNNGNGAAPGADVGHTKSLLFEADHLKDKTTRTTTTRGSLDSSTRNQLASNSRKNFETQSLSSASRRAVDIFSQQAAMNANPSGYSVASAIGAGRKMMSNFVGKVRRWSGGGSGETSVRESRIDESDGEDDPSVSRLRRVEVAEPLANSPANAVTRTSQPGGVVDAAPPVGIASSSLFSSSAEQQRQ